MAGENSGKIVSLMTSDTELVGQTLPMMIFSVSAPIQVAVILYLLYRQIQYLCFVPIGVLFVVIPIAALLGAKVFAPCSYDNIARFTPSSRHLSKRVMPALKR